jgi:4-hydroxy-tetrahydrodipicolinate reductase
MKIILVGYGKMGKTIEKIALSRGHEVAARIDVDNQSDLTKVEGDVAIEFSHPDAAFGNIQTCLRRNIPVVSGTTGWLTRKPEIEKLTRESNSTFFYASNYSIGVNVFFKLNEFLASMINRVHGYNVSID